MRTRHAHFVCLARRELHACNTVGTVCGAVLSLRSKDARRREVWGSLLESTGHTAVAGGILLGKDAPAVATRGRPLGPKRGVLRAW